MNTNSLTEYSSNVIGWDSAVDVEKQEILVRDSSTETVNQTEVMERSVTKEETKDVGVQASPIVLSNSNEETDRKLAAWLQKILPALEKELSDGPTPIHHNQNSSRNLCTFAKVSEYQEIDVNSHFLGNNDKDLIRGNFLWLSVILQNNPVLVISCSVKDESSNSSSHLLLFEPYRNKSDGNVYWKEISSLPVKEHIEFLEVNSENRDIFAGASTFGDLFIWEYDRATSQIIEIFSKACEDSIAGITFGADNSLICCFSNDGNIISYKIVGRQNCIVDKVMRIDQKRLKESSITAICSIHNNFAIGLLSGKIFYCSTNQVGTADPIIKDLSAHKFAVKSLKHVKYQDRKYLISFDASCEIFIHEIEEELSEKSLKYVIRLPLPVKNSISFTSNMEHIFCPLANGNLEIFNSRSHRRRIIEGSTAGIHILSELSKNESWLITGIFKGIFKIYHITLDDE